jgi:3-hydroxyisobutyrate dehydrogenase-like beta-hydroxyacid dehydrogenase
MDIGFIGLGKMGFPMARRLIEAKHQLLVFDTRKEAIDKLVAIGAQPAGSPKEIADRVETVMASLRRSKMTQMYGPAVCCKKISTSWR